MKRITALIIIAVMVAFASFAYGASPINSNTAQGVDLARLDGWDIVVADDAIASEIYAAEEFQEFFRQASGVKLPIVHKITRWDKHVFIGSGTVMQASPVGFGVEDLGPEDLHIVVRDDNIAIAGGRPRGTLYGVYTFLEDYLGVRFLTHDHTHVPKVGELHLVGPVDITYKPPFPHFRIFSSESAEFSLRQRDKYYRNDPKYGGITTFGNQSHSHYRQVSSEKYGQDHPEYFALVGGKRKIGHMVTDELCLTNPEVLPLVTDAVLREIGQPGSIGRRNFSVSRNDSIDGYCRCEPCSAIADREESQMGPMLDFVNKVADEIAKTHPDLYVGTLAYIYTRKPPRHLRPRDNVQINLCSWDACQLHAFTDPNCPINVAFMQDLQNWSKISKHLYAWTYNGNFNESLLPYPDLYAIGSNIRALADAGIEGVHMSRAGSGTELSDLRAYLTYRLLWNPKLDAREVINEFVDLRYGQAAPLIHQYIELTHNHYREAGFHLNSTNPGKNYPQDLPVDAGVAAASLELFAEAVKLAENDEIKARVEKLSISAYRAVLDPLWRQLHPWQKEDAKIDRALAEQMRPLAQEFFQLCDKHGFDQTWASRASVAAYRARIKGIWGTLDPADK